MSQKMSDRLKEVLKKINEGYIIEDVTPKEYAPEYGKQYALTGGSDTKCIANGNTWKESEVK